MAQIRVYSVLYVEGLGARIKVLEAALERIADRTESIEEAQWVANNALLREDDDNE